MTIFHVNLQIEDKELNDFEPPPPSVSFSEDVLHRAMTQSLSIWKSHSDTSASRRKSQRPYRRHYSMDEEEDVQSSNGSNNGNDDDDDDDDNFEPPIHTKVVTWSGKDRKNLVSLNNWWYDPKIWTMPLYHRVTHPRDADRMVNSVELD